MNDRLGFIGCGNMAQAIARAAIDQGVVEAKDIIASNPSAPKRELFASWGCQTTDDNTRVIAQAQQIIIGVKPQKFPEIAPQIAEHLSDDQVLISVMAGLTSGRINELVDRPCRVVRAMPNTPLFVGQGMTGVARCEGARLGDEDLALELFRAGGKAIAVEESLIDAVAAVSGSGPAYLFYLAQAMEQAAEQLGLAEHAEAMVAQTLLGASKLLADSDDSAAQLRQKVTSPGGTTQAAIGVMDQAGMLDTIINALHANVARSQELSQG